MWATLHAHSLVSMCALSLAMLLAFAVLPSAAGSAAVDPCHARSGNPDLVPCLKVRAMCMCKPDLCPIKFALCIV